jgi:polysaccharide export outer membrane protein
MAKNWMVRWGLFALVLSWVTGCTINKDIMFQTPEGFAFDEINSIVESDYRIAANDLIDFQLYSNEGQRILTPTAGSLDSGEAGRLNLQNQRPQSTYWVRTTGYVELPEIGDIKLLGLTIQEAQDALERAYSEIYLKPYALLRIINNRVFVFPGDAGLARVITLENMNTTVLEALALAGGISKRGNAEVVKLIRTEDGKRKVYAMNLSTIDGLQASSVTMQAGDILYVEPIPEIATEVIRDVTPWMSLISSFGVLYALINNLRN